MIPKIIHYCWFGGSEIPVENVQFIEDWSKLNPDFQIKLWSEDNSPMHVKYLQTAHESKQFANMSNFIRLYALSLEGGIYLDVDVKLVKSLESVLGDSCFFGFEEGDENSETFWVNNAICGAIRGNEFIQECYQFLISNFDGTEQSNLSGPRLTTELLTAKGLKHYGLQNIQGIKLYPKEYFYPIHYTEVFKLNSLQKYLFPETLAVHVWARSWLSNKMLLNIIDDLYEKDIINKSNHIYYDNVNLTNAMSSDNDVAYFDIRKEMSALAFDFLFFKSILTNLKSDNDKLSNHLKSVEEKLRSAEYEAISMKHGKELVVKDFNFLVEKQKYLEDLLTQKDNLIEELKYSTFNMKSEISTANEVVKEYITRNNHLIETNNILKEEKETLLLDIQLKSVRFEEVEALKAEIIKYKNDLEQVSNLLNITTEENLSVSENSTLNVEDVVTDLVPLTIYNSLQSENAALKAEIDRLNEENSSLIKYKSNFDSNQVELQSKISNKNIEINRLKNEVKYLKQALSWYKATFEDRKFGGIVKDKITKSLTFNPKVKEWLNGYHKIKKASNNRLSKKILCSVVNYNCNDNAISLRKNLSRFFDTVVLDSGSKNSNRAFVNLGNVYYSGLLNNSYKIAKEKGYDFLFFICSDVEISQDEVNKLVSSLEQTNLDEIGLYSPASRGRSHSFCKRIYENGLRPVPFTEGFIFMSSIDVLDQFLPIDLNVNLYGWGLDVTKGYFARKLGKLCVIDDGVEVYHPESTGYSNEKAELDMWHWVDSFSDHDFKNFFTKHIDLIRNGQANSLEVSIIIPCYNQSPYIKETLYSVLLQEYTALEVLVIDDGSTDDSATIIKEISERFPIIKYYYKENGGLGNTRNYGLEIAKGEYIQFLDADDKLSNNKLLNQIYSIINDKSIEVSYTPYLCFEHEDPTNTWTYSRVELNDDPALDLIQNWEKDLSIPVHCFLIKREILAEISFDEELPNHEDWLFHLYVASANPKYKFINDGIAYYRVRKDSMARDRSLMILGKNMCLEKAISSGKFDKLKTDELLVRLNVN